MNKFSWTTEKQTKSLFTHAVAAAGSFQLLHSSLAPFIFQYQSFVVISSVDKQSRVSFLIRYQHRDWFTPAPHSEWPISATSLTTHYAAWKYFSSCVLLHIHSAPWISLVQISIETVISTAFWDVILDSAIKHCSLDLVLRPAHYRSY